MKQGYSDDVSLEVQCLLLILDLDAWSTIAEWLALVLCGVTVLTSTASTRSKNSSRCLTTVHHSSANIKKKVADT